MRTKKEWTTRLRRKRFYSSNLSQKQRTKKKLLLVLLLKVWNKKDASLLFQQCLFHSLFVQKIFSSLLQLEFFSNEYTSRQCRSKQKNKKMTHHVAFFFASKIEFVCLYVRKFTPQKKFWNSKSCGLSWKVPKEHLSLYFNITFFGGSKRETKFSAYFCLYDAKQKLQ